MRKSKFVVWTALFLLFGGGKVRADRGPLTGTLPFRDFAEFLTARDFVVEGVVESSTVNLKRSMACTCGVAPLGPYRVVEVDLAVTRVWHGTAPDSLVRFTTLFARDPVPAGTRLLVWGFYECSDDWRPWGYFCVVRPDGRITGGDPGEYTLLGHDDSKPTQYADLAAELEGRPGLIPSPRLFEGASSIALLRLIRVQGRGEDGYTYECDSVGWTLGSGNRAPRFIDFPRVADCIPEILPGDSLLVPLPAGFSGERLEIDSCPRAFSVKQGVAAGFGIQLSEVTRVFATEHDRVHVRPIRVTSGR